MADITIKTDRPRVEELFAPYRTVIGRDYDGYRNHVYRGITYAMHFLNNALEHERLVETAFVYHDIGLWTDHKLAYLEPSEAVALHDNEKYGWALAPDALRGAIHWHLKVFRYKETHQNVIEACRKADWIDATQGCVRKGMSSSAIARSRSNVSQLRIPQIPLTIGKGIRRIHRRWRLQGCAWHCKMVTLSCLRKM